MRPRLRVFIGEDEQCHTDFHAPDVTLSLEELTEILQDAVRCDRTWLRDFRDEPVKISADLYEVLTAYSQLRPSA